MGSGSSATVAGGVAIGEGSVSGTAGGVAGYVPPPATGAQAAAIVATTSTTGSFAVGDAASGVFRQITGVAAGSADSDAVNVAQLKAVNSNVSELSDRAVKYDVNPDGTVNYNNVTMGGTTSSNGGVTGGTTITNVHQGAVNATSTDAVNGAQLYNIAGDTSNAYVTENGRGVRYVRTNDAGLPLSDAFAQGEGSTALGYNASTTTGATNAVAIGNGATASHEGSVALGSGSTTAAAVATTGTTINGTRYTFAGAAPESTVSVGAVGAERTVTNVAAGRVDANSTDAVNGSQLQATNTAVEAVDDRVTTLQQETVTQLQGVRKDAAAGAAAAMAMAGMPQAFLPGKSMAAAGVASYDGQSSIAIGVSRLSDNGRWVVKLNVSADTRSKFGVAAGVGFHW
jgi:autotransporter adhesin